MKKSDVDYTLYLCTDRDLMRADTVEDAVRPGTTWRGDDGTAARKELLGKRIF